MGFGFGICTLNCGMFVGCGFGFGICRWDGSCGLYVDLWYGCVV